METTLHVHTARTEQFRTYGTTHTHTQRAENTHTGFSPGQNDAYVVKLVPPLLVQSCVAQQKGAVQRKYVSMGEIPDIKTQQALIVRDLVFILLGNEGNYIRFSSKGSSTEFKIAKSLDISLKLITKKLVKYGKYYVSLVRFLEAYDTEKYGRVVQNLCHKIKEVKSLYEQAVVQIEAQFKNNAAFSVSTLEAALKDIHTPLFHLHEITSDIIQESATRSQAAQTAQTGHSQPETAPGLTAQGLDNLNVDATPFPVARGGVVLRYWLHRMSRYKGDAPAYKFLSLTFDYISRNYVYSLSQWLQHGAIDDPFGEFMVKQTRFQLFLTAEMQMFWDERFKVRLDGLVLAEVQNKVLLTGKWLNIFKQSVGVENLAVLGEQLPAISSLLAPDLELKVDQYYQRANKLLLKLFFEGFGFQNVNRFYQDYYLMQGLHYDAFIDANIAELGKSKYRILILKLQKSFRQSVHQPQLEVSLSTLSFYEIAREVLAIEPQLSFTETASESSDEAAIFSVHISTPLPFPLNLLLNYNFNLQYQLIFNNQLLLKYLTRLCDDSWKEVSLTRVWRHRYDAATAKWIVRSRALLARMRAFVAEFAYHVNYDVILPNTANLNAWIGDLQTQLRNQPITSEIADSIPEADLGSRMANRLATGAYSHLFSHPLQELALEMDFNGLLTEYSTRLNNIMRDTFLVSQETLAVLEPLFKLIMAYSNFLMKLKLSLIACDAALYGLFQELYPENFREPHTAALKARVFGSLNGELNWYYETFGGYISEFMGGIEGPLLESLERCFPG